MATSKIGITINKELLKRLDRLVADKRFPNRSRAIQEAVEEKIERLERTRLANESAKLEPHIEQTLADEGLARDFSEWPEY